MPVSDAIICLGKGAKLAPAEFQRDLRSNWPELDSVTKPQKSGEKKREIWCTVGDVKVTISVEGTPVPWIVLKAPCENSLLWEGAEKHLKDHRGHLLVTVEGDLKPIDLVTRLTQVTASLAGTATGVVGVYWKNANLVVPPELFRHFAIDVMPDGPPMPIWVDTCVGINPEGYTCGYTTGMKSLGFMEIEAISSSDLPKELRQRFHGLAYYLVENGPVIQDGDMLGQTDVEQIRVSYSESAFGRDEKVIRLNYMAVKRRRKGWFL